MKVKIIDKLDHKHFNIQVFFKHLHLRVVS
jgi:hypothetical protein